MEAGAFMSLAGSVLASTAAAAALSGLIAAGSVMSLTFSSDVPGFEASSRRVTSFGSISTVDPALFGCE